MNAHEQKNLTVYTAMLYCFQYDFHLLEEIRIRNPVACHLCEKRKSDYTFSYLDTIWK
jgi:hypothetical protein